MASLVYTDTEFLNADWTAYHEGSGTLNAATQDTDEGNPAPSRYVQNTAPASETSYGFHMKNSATWDPSISEGIASIDFSLDGMPIAPTIGAGLGFTFALRQGGRNFEVISSDGVGDVADVWKTITYAGLNAANFQTVTGGVINPDFSASGGVVTFGFRTGLSASLVELTLQALFDNWSMTITPVSEPVVPPGEPGGPAVQSPLDRYRSSISADAGSLLATTRAVPFDTSHSIAFSPAGELSQDALYPFHEATSIQSGTPDVMFYPRARQSIDGPVSYDGVTILTLMERVYPAQILTRTSDVALGVTATAQAIITYVFTQWAAQFAWFTYKPVPDLRLRDVSLTATTNRTVLFDSVIRVLQSDTSPRSMRAMLEDLLSPFPGTQFYMDSDGDLAIRPVYGPDADATPAKTLATSDVVTISIGEPSVDNIVNRATVGFTQFTQTEDVSVLEPAYVQVASNYLRDASFSPGPPVTGYLYTAPTDRLNLTTEDAGFGGWRSIPLGDGIIMGDAAISFVDPGLLITAELKTFDSAGVLVDSFTSPGTLTVDVFSTVPLSGATVLAFGVRRGAGYSSNFHGRWNARWNTTTKALEIQWAGGQLEVDTFLIGLQRVAVMGVTINGVSTAWAEGATINATFGVVADGDFIPGPSDTNALATSVTAFGVLEERFAIQGYGGLLPGQLERIAEAFVIQNLTPRATRELALGWKGAVGLEFDDRGRLIAFPTSAEGLLTGVRYADDFIASAGAKTITVEETVPGSPGTIDFDAVFLLFEDGSIWTNENGSVSPPA